MRILRGLESLPIDDGPSVVTIGFFDGVHRGHQEVFARTVERARERDARSVAITFDRHPREVITPGNEPRLLTTVERRAQLIGETGIDLLLVLEFTPAFASVTAEDFVKNVLVDGVGAVHAVVGANFTYGYKAMGNITTLPQMGAPYGMTAESMDLLQIEGRPVSSSSIREALAQGDLEWPVLAMGRRFVLDGRVVQGHGRGTGLGYPTANLETWPRLLLPGQGIYAGIAEVRGQRYLSAIDVGTNPTFGVEPLHAEAFLIDFEGGSIGGEDLSLEFWHRLRDEVKYDEVDQLIDAIAGDVRKTRSLVDLSAAGL